MGNPAYAYCTEIMGYEYEVVTMHDGAQDGFCKMPDGLVCPQWDFYSGKCGQEYSYCVQIGANLELHNDGKDPFSREYSICVDKKGQELGSFWDLSGYRMVTSDFDKGLFLLENAEELVSPLPPTRDIPSSFDWRNYGGIDWMTSVKNQLNCGSCWAFSSVGLAEAQNNIIPSDPNIDLNLSEQYLVSTCCDWCGDCDGGVEIYGLEYIRDEGVPDEDCYPYMATNSLCSARCVDYTSRLKYIPNAHWARNTSEPYQYTESDIKNIISNYGPVTFGIGIDTPSGSYFDDDILRCEHDIPSDGTYYADHAVLGVGYNDEGGYWIVKNSWGSAWNGDGYFKLGYNECNVAHTRIGWVESDLPNTNQAPIANAGPDQVVTTNSPVTLNGSGSDDPDNNDPITYQWTQTAGTSVSLSSSTVANPTFTSPAASGLLTFRLVVTDSLGLASAPDSVNIFNGIEPSFELYLPLIMKPGSTGFNSQFNGNADGWEVHSGMWYYDDTSLFTYGNAGNLSTVSYAADFTNLDYKVQLARAGSQLNGNQLFIRGKPDPLSLIGEWYEGYIFQYSANGNYSILKTINGVTSEIKSWTFSSAINQGYTWNTLRITANGGTLKFYINGSLVWSGTNTSLTSGRVGIGMYLASTSTTDWLVVDWATLTTSVSTSVSDLDQISPEQQLLNDAMESNSSGDLYNAPLD